MHRDPPKQVLSKDLTTQWETSEKSTYIQGSGCRTVHYPRLWVPYFGVRNPFAIKLGILKSCIV